MRSAIRPLSVSFIKKMAVMDLGINCGIQNALGRYMKVVDADDWVDPEALDHLIAALKNCRDDVLVSGFYWRFDNGSGEESSFPKKAEIPEPFSGVKYGISYEFDGIANQIYMKMHGITWRTEILRQMPLPSMNTAITLMQYSPVSDSVGQDRILYPGLCL